MPRRRKDDDEISDVSAGDADSEVPEEEDRFKYSTANISDSRRNTTCCLITVCIICIIIAIVISVLVARIDKNDSSPMPEATEPPTNETDRPPGLGMFTMEQEFVSSRCSQAAIETQRPLCESLCRGFDCCDPSLPFDENCFNTDYGNCFNYGSCHVLAGRVDPPPPNIDDICAAEQVAMDRTQCELQCLDVRCCYEEDRLCTSDDFYACVDYLSCQNLRDTVQVPLPTEVIGNFCPNTQECNQLCEPASCCWSTDPAVNCLQTEFYNCLAYHDCNELTIPPAFEVIAAAPSTVPQLCTVNNINTGGQRACEDACRDGECCFASDDTNCFLSDPLACLTYDACKLVF